MIFGICVEKKAELPEGHPDGKYKGRFAFQGNHLRDKENVMALFQDLGSASASMAAAKIIDLIASLPGCRGGQTDAGYPRSTCTRTRFPSNTAAQSHTGSAPASCSALA